MLTDFHAVLFSSVFIYLHFHLVHSCTFYTVSGDCRAQNANMLSLPDWRSAYGIGLMIHWSLASCLPLLHVLL